MVFFIGAAWYLFLITQPYFATHGQIARHRTYGIIGMFIAGSVCFTALSMMHRDLATAELAAADPQRFGPFQPWFFFGLAVVEIVMMTAFGSLSEHGNIKKLKHPGTFLAIAINLFNLLVEPLGRSETVQAFLINMIKG